MRHNSGVGSMSEIFENTPQMMLIIAIADNNSLVQHVFAVMRGMTRLG